MNPSAVVQLPNEYQEYAVFTNGTYKFTDTFHLSAGIRYAKNDQDFRQISFGLIVPTSDVPGESDEDVVTYSLSPEWHFSEDTMLYARVATGYRPGGPNVFLPGVPPTVDSDSMTNYEIGVKSSLAGGAVQLEAAVFYMDWDDIQLGVAFPNGTSRPRQCRLRGKPGHRRLADLAGRREFHGRRQWRLHRSRAHLRHTETAHRRATACRARRNGAARFSPTTSSKREQPELAVRRHAPLRGRSHLGSGQPARIRSTADSYIDRRPQCRSHDQRPLDDPRLRPERHGRRWRHHAFHVTLGILRWSAARISFRCRARPAAYLRPRCRSRILIVAGRAGA